MLVKCQPEEAEQEDKSIQGHGLQLKVVKDSLDVLRSINKPLAILSVCGPYRTGKSYLLSRILGSHGSFKVGNTMEACTRGIWMATTILESENSALLLLDTEGMDSCEGDAGDVFINRLMIVTTLFSSFLIYNSASVPEWSDLEDLRYAAW